ncbi:MAG: hypothetical protein KAT46_04575 [Deltaproteobacteria bacterium]|nr:hypothetical protein [Deltaproteobacteria bacterium]
MSFFEGKFLRLFFVFTIIILFAGCTPPPYRANYDAAVTSKRYSDAYSILKGVCEVKPKESYCKQLNIAKSRFAGERFSTLRANIKNTSRPISLSEIENFKGKLAEIQALDKKIKVQKTSKKLKSEEKATKRAVDKALSDAVRADKTGDKKLAIDHYRRASNLDSKVNKEMDEYITTAVKSSYDSAKKAAEAGDWKAAHLGYDIAHYISPKYKDVKKLLAKTKLKDTYGYHVEEASKLKEEGRMAEALAIFELASDYKVTDTTKKEIRSVKLSLAKTYFDDGIDLLSEGLNLSAGMSFVKGIGFYKSLSKAGRRKIRLPKTEMSRVLNELAEVITTQTENGNWGRAYLAANIIYKMQPDYTNISKIRNSLNRQIKKKSEQYVGVKLFNSPTYNKDAGAIITSRLQNFMYKELAGEIKILEREAMADIVRERLVGASAGGGGVSKLAVVDYLVLGAVVDFKVDSSVRKSRKTKRAKVDSRKIANPDYTYWLGNRKGKQPPKFIEEPTYETVSYETQKHKKTVLAEVSYRVTNSKSDVILNNVAEKKETVTGESSEGIEIGDLSIPSKEVSLPSNSAMLRKATSVIIKQIGKDLKKLFSGSEKRFIKEARIYERKGSFDLALKSLIKARFVKDRKNQNTDEIDLLIYTLVVDKAGM